AREREERDKWQRIKKLQEDLAAAETNNSTGAAERRGQAVDNKQRLESNGAELYSGDETRRQLSATEVQARKDAVSRTEAEHAKASQETSDRNYQAKLSLQDHFAQRETVVAQRQTNAHEAVVAQTDQLGAAETARIAKANERRTTEREAVVQRMDGVGQPPSRPNGNETNQRAVEDEKRTASARETTYAQNSEQSRARAKEHVEGLNTGQQRTFAEFNRNKLAQEYPPGVTEESLTEGNKVIIRRVVVNGNKGDEYTKVIAKSGVYFFKNGQSITEVIWIKETEG
ncbi:MAG TPA: hypothetical protein PK760_16335, partial [Flavobacteriales bacterium]|nr:hypothetical protein [Flavobacteriales bacterium]